MYLSGQLAGVAYPVNFDWASADNGDADAFTTLSGMVLKLREPNVWFAYKPPPGSWYRSSWYGNLIELYNHGDGTYTVRFATAASPTAWATWERFRYSDRWAGTYFDSDGNSIASIADAPMRGMFSQGDYQVARGGVSGLPPMGKVTTAAPPPPAPAPPPVPSIPPAPSPSPGVTPGPTPAPSPSPAPSPAGSLPPALIPYELPPVYAAQTIAPGEPAPGGDKPFPWWLVALAALFSLRR